MTIYEEKNEDLANRIIKNTILNKQTGCWEWQLHTNRINGYGTMWIAQTADKKYIWNTAHRTSYLVFKGELPFGMEVAHNCHNPKCCNPNHLVAATHQENIRMSVDDGRTLRGTEKVQSKLTDAEVRTIKQGRLLAILSIEKVADLFNVHATTIRSVLAGRTWSHIEA